MDKLGQEIRRARKWKNMSIRDIARKIHRSHSFLWDIEEGNRYPSVATLKSIAGAMNIKYEFLYTILMVERPTISY